MRELLFKKGNAVFIGIAVIFLVGLVLYFGRGTVPFFENDRIPVSATIFPLYDIVRTIGGDKVDVTLVLQPGESLDKIDDAYSSIDISGTRTLFAFGEFFDAANAPTAIKDRVFIVDSYIETTLQEGLTGNPFYWLSIENASYIADNVAEKLSELDPKNTEYYIQNRDQFIANVDLLFEGVVDLFANAPQRKIAVYGYDWSYFANALDLEIISFSSPFKYVDTSTTIDEFMVQVGDAGLGAVLSDIYADPQPLLPLLTNLRFSILSLDAIGGTEERQNYLDLMAYNARTIYEALST